MIFQVDPLFFAPSRGWLAAYRDFRVIKASDADIPKRFVMNSLGLDEDSYLFLLEAFMQDESGELLSLSEGQFHLIYQHGRRWCGVLFSCALEALRLGLLDCVCEDWATSIADNQIVADAENRLALAKVHEGILRAQVASLNQEILVNKQAALSGGTCSAR